MKNLANKFGIIFALIVTLSCDKIPLEKIQKKPLPILKCTDPVKIVNQSDTTVLVKKIYLEYFTGHLCGNCPSSSGAAFTQIEAAYPSKIVIAKIHSNFFARLQPPKYTNNLTYPGGDRIYSNYKVTSVPTGMVDRTAYNKNTLMSPSEWINAVNARGKTAPIVRLMLNTQYCESSRSLLVNSTINFLNSYNAPISVEGYITENNVVGMQLDYDQDPKDVPNFVHKYVLREDLSVSESFAPANSYSSGSEGVTTFAANLKTAWNEKECYVVVIVTDQRTGEVLQVEQVKIYNK